jgi:hypothetical protein
VKRELPARGISRFINDAIRPRLRLTGSALDEAYEAAAREPWPKAAAHEWQDTDIERWPM